MENKTTMHMDIPLMLAALVICFYFQLLKSHLNSPKKKNNNNIFTICPEMFWDFGQYKRK